MGGGVPNLHAPDLPVIETTRLANAESASFMARNLSAEELMQ